MKMQEMDSYFVSKGFKVSRKYYRNESKNPKPDGYYKFVISKNGHALTDIYSWPNDQQSFMDRMIEKFEKEFSKVPEPKGFCCMDDVAKYAEDHCCGVTISGCMGEGTEVTVECGADVITRTFKDDEPFLWVQVKNMVDVLTREDTPVYMGGVLYHIDEWDEYCKNDVKNTEKMWTMFNNLPKILPLSRQRLEPQIKDVIFSPPATIVMWDDGTKTVVKAQAEEEYDLEKGLAMAISKKALGNKRDYYHTFLHWLKRYEKEHKPDPALVAFIERVRSGVIKPDVVVDTKSAKYDLVQKAYNIAIRLRNTEEIDSLDDIIGYLGEALDD